MHPIPRFGLLLRKHAKGVCGGLMRSLAHSISLASWINTSKIVHAHL
jgi:hypothetical protein